MEHEKSPLYIPMGLREDAEIFPGFGKVELFKSLAVLLLFIGIALLVFVVIHSPEAAIIILILGVATGIGLFAKDNTNNSVADRIADVLRFSRSKKRYPYVVKDELNL